MIGAKNKTEHNLSDYEKIRAAFSWKNVAKKLSGLPARKELGPAVTPKEIEFVENIPKTRSGKILRRLLKARELGLPEGDISKLEQS
jgi:acyl-coenzyme A synthetase/AMP-(fatty) acid ligase